MSVEGVFYSVPQALSRNPAPTHSGCYEAGSGVGEGKSDEPEHSFDSVLSTSPQLAYLPELPKRSHQEFNLPGFSLPDLKMTLERVEKQQNPGYPTLLSKITLFTDSLLFSGLSTVSFPFHLSTTPLLSVPSSRVMSLTLFILELIGSF